MSIERRKGRLSVSRELINEVVRTGDNTEQLAAWAAIFGEFVVLEVETSFLNDTITYSGHHPQFDEVPLGYRIPDYLASIRRDTGTGGKVTFGIRFERST
jgi:hypothetical protein